jgi:hypothetical protein
MISASWLGGVDEITGMSTRPFGSHIETVGRRRGQHRRLKLHKASLSAARA